MQYDRRLVEQEKKRLEKEQDEYERFIENEYPNYKD